MPFKFCIVTVVIVAIVEFSFEPYRPAVYIIREQQKPFECEYVVNYLPVEPV